MKTINLETCDRQTLRDLGIQFTDSEVSRMGCGATNNWTEVHAVVSKDTLPTGAMVLSSGAFYGVGCVAVRDGHIVDRAFRGACPWWDDSIHSLLCVPEEGETLHEFGASMDSSSFCYEDDGLGLGLYRQAGDWGWNTPLCFNCHLFAAGWLRSIGATKDAKKVEALEVAAEKAAKKARYEAARDRAELLYPYDGAKVFRARIRWALEDGVASAAKALAPHVKFLSDRLRPCGGWPCHYRRISAAWHAAYGWNMEPALDALLLVCSKISQPRLDAAWQVAKILNH